MNQLLTKITNTINSMLGNHSIAFKLVPLKLYQLTKYTCPLSGLSADLSEYYIDADGDLYSRNSSTPVTNYGMKLVKLANGVSQRGDYINSLRDLRGNKITVRRSILKHMRDMNKFRDVSDNNLMGV